MEVRLVQKHTKPALCCNSNNARRLPVRSYLLGSRDIVGLSVQTRPNAWSMTTSAIVHLPGARKDLVHIKAHHSALWAWSISAFAWSAFTPHSSNGHSFST